MKYIQSAGGYFYKVYKNGNKKRISNKEYTKKNKNYVGGADILISKNILQHVSTEDGTQVVTYKHKDQYPCAWTWMDDSVIVLTQIISEMHKHLNIEQCKLYLGDKKPQDYVRISLDKLFAIKFVYDIGTSQEKLYENIFDALQVVLNTPSTYYLQNSKYNSTYNRFLKDTQLNGRRLMTRRKFLNEKKNELTQETISLIDFLNKLYSDITPIINLMIECIGNTIYKFCNKYKISCDCVLGLNIFIKIGVPEWHKNDESKYRANIYMETSGYSNVDLMFHESDVSPDNLLIVDVSKTNVVIWNDEKIQHRTPKDIKPDNFPRSFISIEISPKGTPNNSKFNSTKDFNSVPMVHVENTYHT